MVISSSSLPQLLEYQLSQNILTEPESTTSHGIVKKKTENKKQKFNTFSSGPKVSFSFCSAWFWGRIRRIKTQPPVWTLNKWVEAGGKM
jgi:hypothetical protein